MRFIHIADTHLGAEPDKGFPWAGERKEQVSESFLKVIERCRAERPDLLLIAGDMFHKQPLVRELKEVDSLFASMPDVRVVIIAGNHDYISGISNYNGFEWSENVTFFRTEQLESVYFEDINTEVYGLSFCHRQIHEALLDNARPVHPDRINILLMHGGEPGNLPADRKKLAGAGFDYIACGHIHVPLTVNERMIYPGSTEPLERNDTGSRGYILGNIEKHGTESRINTEFGVCVESRYFKEDLIVEPVTTNYELGAMIRDRIAERGEKGIFSFTIKGRRDPDIEFDTETLMKEGRIVYLSDETEPDYDFDRLLAENRDNIIGKFIEKIKAENVDPEIAEKALDYGILALYKGKK
ncbi:MAG: DNA repair exonuclease [Lachnospiraceae bacterium]|nr:DNA repair exonuclease [Lachnospiraceae bacterium]